MRMGMEAPQDNPHQAPAVRSATAKVEITSTELPLGRGRPR